MELEHNHILKHKNEKDRTNQSKTGQRCLHVGKDRDRGEKSRQEESREQDYSTGLDTDWAGGTWPEKRESES